MAKKKALELPLDLRRSMIDRENVDLSISQQCQALGICRSGLYYDAVSVSDSDDRIMKLIDRQYLQTPFYGSRRMVAALARKGTQVNRKRVQRLMRLMGLKAIYPRPKTTLRHPQHEIYPYLLRDLPIETPNHVWATDLTYLPMRRGFMYVMAIIDWWSRYVVAWGLSNTMDVGFCVSVLAEALSRQKPQIFNSDQGSQFTSKPFIQELKAAEIRISMDGVGRCLDNVFVERLWRSLKYEEVYLKDYEDGADGRKNLTQYFDFFNHKRPHQSLGYKTPAEIYFGKRSGRAIS